METSDEGGPERACAFPDVECLRSDTAGTVVEPERLPDGRAITYFSAGPAR